MAVLTMTGDEVTLHSLAGTSTFLRARRHLAAGEVQEVVHHHQGSDGAVLEGSVGPRSESWVAVAILERRTSGDLHTLGGSCTCGAPSPCQHTVALALLSVAPGISRTDLTVRTGEPSLLDDAGSAPRVKVPQVKAPPMWVGALTGFLDHPPETEPLLSAELALQFEVVAVAPAPVRGPSRTARSIQHRADQPSFQILVRPVQRSNAGSWVRSGISWSHFGYNGYLRVDLSQRQRQLVEELAALRPMSPYGHRENTLDLSTVTSRRL